MRDTVSTLEQALNVRSLEIEQLKLQLAKLRRMQFGRKSEKLDRQIEQLEIRLEDLLAEEGESQDREAISATPPQAEISAPAPAAHLPREERVLEPAEQACPSCGGELKPLGEDVSEQLALIDAAFKVNRHIRCKKAYLHAVCPAIGKEVGVMRLCVAEDGDDTRQSGVHSGAHVQGKRLPARRHQCGPPEPPLQPGCALPQPTLSDPASVSRTAGYAAFSMFSTSIGVR